tara:strand:- start:18520 stop:18945 length:426 start_codon:yes stop_codon:yes gene_type:complete
MRLIIIFFCLFYACSQKPNPGSEVQIIKPIASSKVYFKNINNGDTLISPFVVDMGVNGMQIKPAGQVEAGTGHHHILVDKNFMNYGEIIPMDAQHLHYGKGDTTVTLTLPSGPHTLTLQFANGLHMSYGEQYSKSISIYIK